MQLNSTFSQKYILLGHFSHGAARPSRVCAQHKSLPNDKWPPGIDPGGHRFLRQNMAFSRTPIFGFGTDEM